MGRGKQGGDGNTDFGMDGNPERQRERRGITLRMFEKATRKHFIIILNTHTYIDMWFK